MSSHIAEYLLLGIAAIPFIYYGLVLYSAGLFFIGSGDTESSKEDFTPPVSIVKPIRGLDPGAYENFASFCQQDYPEYEILFCVDGEDDPVMPVIEKLRQNYPDRGIRVLFGSGRVATNDKVAKLERLVSEARYETLVINDSDVRVGPEYLRKMVAPLRDPRVGATTCFYVPLEDGGFVQNLQAIGMASDFYPGILVARKLDGVKFALGPSIATTRAHLASFGGYAAIENRPADDLLVGRLIAEQGYEVRLLRYWVSTVPDYDSLRNLFFKRLRWLVVMRHMRPWGHAGLIFTLALPWILFAAVVAPHPQAFSTYLATYLALRVAMTWLIGIHGLQQPSLWRMLPLIPVWDLMALLVWMASFAGRSIRWRGGRYRIENGALVPITTAGQK